MLDIKIDNSHSQIVTDSPELKRHISDALSYEVPGSRFAQQATPWWDGRVRLMNKAGVFPTGLIPHLIVYLRREKIPYRFTDVRTKPRPSCVYRLNLPFPARDYQTEAAATERSRGVLVIGTGGGKSLTSAMIVNRYKVPTLIVTPDTGLREQLYKDYAAWFGERHVGKDVADKKSIIVANIQSLAKKPPALFTRFHMLVIDEFHHAAAKTYQAVNQMCSNAFYRYGFTGTFVRPDGADMEMYGVLSQVIFKKSTSELIEEDYLVRPYITIVQYSVPKMRVDYKKAYDYIVEDYGFNKLVAAIAEQKAFEHHKQTLILVRRKEHGRVLQELLPDAIYLNGDDPMPRREQVKRDFIEKKVRCLIATSIFGEGIDIPSIDVLINARCQKTEIQTSQGIGRALRLAEGKDKAEVYDFMIVGQKHLEDHSVERLNSYRKEPAFKIRKVLSSSLF